ncbi:MAG: UvrD-helicase domain-containing protein [Anaerolineaceae bacterium]|nr:UvrD-helicase domain-containing protein [Anaerolineaceae bacterium]
MSKTERGMAAAGLLEGLNDQQREAVTVAPGPVLVLAGPGSGKTRVLTHRVAYMIQNLGIHPSSIMAVTFTNKAAGEMRHRVESLLGGRLQGTQIGTFHSICARMLRREAGYTPYTADYLIYDTDDQVAVITQAMTELNLDTKRFRPRAILNQISNAKNELIDAAHYVGVSYQGEITRRAYARYQEILVANNARDFDDLLMDMVQLLEENEPIRQKYQRFIEHLLVDEFQDTNAAQYRMVELLAQPQESVFVVGDEDQAIYGWRGADYRNVLQFRKDFPDCKVILLEQNYRSTQIVLDAARAVIDHNSNRTRKALFTEQSGGTRITIHEAYAETDEAQFVVESIENLYREQELGYRDFAVMYRTNAQSRALEEAMVKASLPYKLVGGIGFYKRREIRDLLAYLRLVNTPNDSVSFNRIVNVPKRGIGKKSVEDFLRWTARERMTISEGLAAMADGATTPLPNAATKKFTAFWQMIEDWQKIAADGDLAALLDDIIARTGYTLHLHNTSDSTDEALEREDNVRELRGLLAGKVGESLNDVLQEVALVADVDSLAGDDSDTITLMTLHSAKGLEYPVVFLTGLEDGILPHFRSMDNADGLEEERRLLYVGITRAMRQLYLSHAFRRMTYGDSSPSVPSRFLADIPPHLLEGVSSKLRQQYDFNAFLEDTTWDDDEEEPLTERQQTIRARIAPFSPPASAPKPRFRSGVRVQHAKFGEGIVIETRHVGNDEEITVSFAAHGIKRLSANFAKLEILD